MHVDQALLVATTQNDRANTNVAFTVRGDPESVPIVATANAEASVDVLELAWLQPCAAVSGTNGTKPRQAGAGRPHAVICGSARSTSC